MQGLSLRKKKVMFEDTSGSGNSSPQTIVCIVAELDRGGCGELGALRPAQRPMGMIKMSKLRKVMDPR